MQKMGRFPNPQQKTGRSNDLPVIRLKHFSIKNIMEKQQGFFDALDF